MRLATVQLGIRPGETPAARFDRVEALLRGLKGADLILLPELWKVGFFSFDDYRASAEPLEGETVTRLGAVARELGSYLFTGSFIEHRGDRCYNTCALLDRQGGLAAHYSKVHLFGYGSREREVLSSGDKVVTADTDFGRVGLSICYDLRFPELYRKLAEQGAEVLINCAAWPYPRVESWTCLNMARAMENQAYFLSCCCAGGEPGKQFIGRSMVVDPWGTPVAAAGERETVLITDIHPEAVATIREEFTPLKDRVFRIGDRIEEKE